MLMELLPRGNGRQGGIVNGDGIYFLASVQMEASTGKLASAYSIELWIPMQWTLYREGIGQVKHGLVKC